MDESIGKTILDGSRENKSILLDVQKSAFEKLKRKNGFDVPNVPKKLRTSDPPSLSDSNSSLKHLLPEKTRSRIISWRRNTRSLTDQIVMNHP